MYVWLRAVLMFLVRLVLPPPPKAKDRAIDPHQACAVCGNQNHTLEALTITSNPGQGADAVRRTVVKVSCDACGGSFYVKPLAGENADLVIGKREIRGI